MRSADWCLKILVKGKMTMCFWGCDPKSWNSLPLNIKSVDTIDTFKNLSSTCSGLPLFSLYHLNRCVFFCILKHFVTSALKSTLKKKASFNSIWICFAKRNTRVMNASLFDCLLPEQQLKWKSRMKKETLKLNKPFKNTWHFVRSYSNPFCNKRPCLLKKNKSVNPNHAECRALLWLTLLRR